eukprot:9801084-Ditylum_brightwellii.AAC.1
MEPDCSQILELVHDPNISDHNVRRIDLSIYGYKEVKMTLAMSLFGAIPKNVDGKHWICGDVNVLLLGDPGTTKSQMLKYAEKTVPKTVSSTGKGSSTVGLMTSVHKDPITKNWILE